MQLINNKMIEYQKLYVDIIVEFHNKKRKTIDEYFLLIDKIDLLHRKYKRTVEKYLDFERNFLYIGNITEFQRDLTNVYPALIANKRIFAKDQIATFLNILKNEQVLDKDFVFKCIDDYIDNIFEIRNLIINLYVICIDLDDFISDCRMAILNNARIITLKYLNNVLNLQCKTLSELENTFSKYSYDELDSKYPELCKRIYIPQQFPDDSLKEKMERYIKDSHMNFDEDVPIKLIVIILVGYFAQMVEKILIGISFNSLVYITSETDMKYFASIGMESDEYYDMRVKVSLLYMLFYYFIKKKVTISIEQFEEICLRDNLFDNMFRRCQNKEESWSFYEKVVRDVLDSSLICDFLEDLEV